VYIFSAIALFILFLACINFMNLTTARSANRAREVGIRKVLGTQRKDLMLQFLTESTLMVLLSLIIAIAITYFVLPLFNTIAGKAISMDLLFSPLVLPLLVALPFLVGLLAGSYPAFYLSFFRPIEVLKGKLSSGRGNGKLRSSLVVFQFATAIILIVGTIVVYSQLRYIQQKDLGFKKDQVVIVNDAYALGSKVDAFKNEMLQQPGVITGTLSAYLPVNSSRNDNSYSRVPVPDSKNGFNMQSWFIDYDYISTMGMEMKTGRNFSKDYGTDSSAVIINETAAQFLNHSDPLGKKIYTLDSKPVPYTVIGVVKNFHFESLHATVAPLALFLRRSTGIVSFKVKARNIPVVLKTLETKWKRMAPGIPFSYRFMDDSFAEMYESEQRAGKIALIFSILAIVIACLGLFGLATFIAEQRTKEIGIRKVLGASVNGIVQLLSRDFMRLVIIAFVIATPVAWWAMKNWLQDFAYRMDLSWWIFPLAGLVAVVIALVTVSFQAIKAAIANPIKSLRTE
jgi:putative ABC transport system permease protein